MKYYETEFTITGPVELIQDARDLLAAMSGEVGYESFEDTTTGLKGYIQQDLYEENAIAEIIAEFPFENIKVDFTTSEAEYRDWNEQWENEGFMPIYITDDCVVHDGRHLPEYPAMTMVEIDAKLAFGTGTHETTKMVARQLIHENPKGKRVLDCGCGTGILGIAASKLGAKEIIGYDIDEWSTHNATHNASINNVTNMQVMLGDASILKEVKEKFDVVLANINRNILLSDMPVFASLMTIGSTLIISGFYSSDVPLLEEKAAELGMEITGIRTDNEWTCLTLNKKK